MLVLLDIGEDIDFVDGALLKLFVFLEPPHFDDFDCIFLVVVFVYGPIYLSVGSLSNYLIESVVLDDPNHRISK